MIDVMKMALEAFEWNHNTDLDNISSCEQWAKMLKKNIDALRAAIEQAEQAQPVAMVVDPYDTPGLQWLCQYPPKRGDRLYTAPPQRKPLTDKEIADLWSAQIFHINDSKLAKDFVRDIEAAHGIKE